MNAEKRKELLIKTADEMGHHEFDINPECAEYQLLDYLLDDDELTLMSEMKLMGPSFAGKLAKKTGMDPDKAKKVLEGCADKGYILDVKATKGGGKIYLLVPFAPGMFEFQMTRNEDFYLKNPEVSYLFHRHAYESYEKIAPSNPMGVGIMRVIPVESALPADSKVVTMERLSTLIETIVPQKFCLVPCQCRRVRHVMGELTGDQEFEMCLYIGLLADSMLRHGRGREVTKQEAYAHLERVEKMGCIHQITTLEDFMTLAVCNCQPSSCMAIGSATYYGTPNMSRSNYVSEIDAEKCVACGQCVEVCAANALKLGQKICSKNPIVHQEVELPDDIEWGPERFQPNYRDERENVSPEGTSPCKVECPAHIAIQGYIRLAAQGKYRDALELIKKENPFPAVCGRICPHNCENECTRGEIDDPVSIDEIKKFIADREIAKKDRFVPEKLWHFDKKIAIIGSGPAGLSCAYYLAAMGYDKVTVFDREPKPGGMMMNGIPNFRLEKDVIEAEIEVLKDLNVEFRCGVDVGKDVTIQQLRDEGYEAFYLALGLQNGGKLGIPGDDAKGIISGVDFEKAISRGEDIKLGKNVVVIGGGNIGADVARTAVRYGAKKVDLYCLESYDEMPMGEEDQELCKADGITIHDGWGQTEVVVKDGKCKGIKFKKCTSVKDKNGRFAPKFDEKVTEEAKCDTILFCIGQKPDYGKLLEGTKVQFTQRGLVVADPLTYQTDEPDIFCGGDIYTGQKFVIDAIAAGKEGANSINRFVWPGHSLTIGRYRAGYKPIDKQAIDWDNVSYDNSGRQKPHIDKDKVLSKSDERLTFTEQQLKQETERCLKCGATWVDQNKCFGCGICTTRCKFDAIHLVKKFDTRIHGMRFREGFVDQYHKERELKIAVKKFRKEDNDRGGAAKQ